MNNLRGSNPGRGKIFLFFLLFQVVQNGFQAHPVFYSMGTGVYGWDVKC
jgi:hypothetical protein